MSEQLTVPEALRLSELEKIITTNYSGGTKLTELIPDMLHLGFTQDDILSIERLLLRYPEAGLKILSYTWKSLNREKLFIYTPSF